VGCFSGAESTYFLIGNASAAGQKTVRQKRLVFAGKLLNENARGTQNMLTATAISSAVFESGTLIWPPSGMRLQRFVAFQAAKIWVWFVAISSVPYPDCFVNVNGSTVMFTLVRHFCSREIRKLKQL